MIQEPRGVNAAQRRAHSAGILRCQTHDESTAASAATAAAASPVDRTDHESPAVATTGATAAIPNGVARLIGRLTQRIL
jgi:hypothetical protein